MTLEIKAAIVVPADGPYFAGHFPGRPILPGVLQLALAVETLARETGSSTPLRAIRFARLRQLVLPGERLELAARAGEGGRWRIDLERDGTPVANAEIELGRPDAPPVASAPGDIIPPPPDLPPLDALLPHRPPMRFVISVSYELADGLACTARIPAACALVAGGSAPALAGIEAAAQTAAVWEAVRRRREGGDRSPRVGPRVGYLVSVREVVFFAERITADAPLVASVRLTAAAPPLTHYSVEVAGDAGLILRGTIATFLTSERAGL